MGKLNNNLLEIIKETPSLESDDNVSSEENVYVFISLDLTNSTKFKNEQPNLWKKVISTFYDVVFELYGIKQYQYSLEDLSKNNDDINVGFWKFVGDEVLLYVNVYNCQEIYDIVKATDNSIKKVMSYISTKIALSYNCQKNCSELDAECDCLFYEKSSSYCNIEKILKSSLGVKATIWLAICGKNDDKKRNIIHSTSSAIDGFFQQETFDFLGPEIDEGFRIAKYAVKNRVIVSPFLANALYLSSNDKDFQSLIKKNFKIVSYQQLKGIWHDRLFPIVMYSSEFENIHEYLEYDEIELPTYSEIKISGFESGRCQVKYLEKILIDVHLKNEADKIIRLLQNENYKRSDKKHTNPIIELHIACASFNESGLLMIHKHERRGWEFGCIPITSSTNTWRKAIIEGYQKKYALNISVPDNPIPIATYTYQKTKYENKTALGIIVLGKFVSSDGENDFKAMNSSQIQELGGEMVEDFKLNAQKAFDTYNAMTKIIAT